MERKDSFVVGEYYHVYNRGVAKQRIFFEEREKERFQMSLYLCNTQKAVIFCDVEKRGFEWSRGDPIAGIVAYTCMPNHFHLIAKETVEGGISKLLGKLLTSHSTYINIKYQRSGPLMCRPFRSKHIDSDEYFRWVLAYVMLNPLELFEPHWKEKGIKDMQKAGNFLRSYRYCSFPDYFVGERKEGRILDKKALPFDEREINSFDEMLSELREATGGRYSDSINRFLEGQRSYS